MQNLFDLYSTNYINQNGQQFTIPDLTVLTGGEDDAAMEQSRNNITAVADNTNANTNANTPPQANSYTSSPTNAHAAPQANSHTTSAHTQTDWSAAQANSQPAPMQTNTMQRSMQHTMSAPADNMPGMNTDAMLMQHMMGNMMPMHNMAEGIKPAPANSMAERIKSRQGCYAFAEIDLGCGHGMAVEGILYEIGDDFFSLFDSARRTLTSYNINDVKWFTTMLSCNDVMDFREDTVIS